MPAPQPLIAKVSRPVIAETYMRKRLIRLLDDGRKKQVIWITAPGGYGKTTLVTSYLDARKLPCLWYQVDKGDNDLATFFYYMGLAAKKAAPRFKKPLPLLTPEYLPGLSTFTLRYFEKLYERIISLGKSGVRRDFILVLDNYQEVPADSLFHEVIRDGLGVIPEGIHVIVISRMNMPDVFARMRSSDKIAIIDSDELRLTQEETGGIIRLKVKKRFSKETVQKIHFKTQGWAAGLTLMMEKFRKGIDTESLGNDETETIFNYFASEIFQDTDVETKVFLLKTAFLPNMTAKMAQALTGVENSDWILSELTHNNYFTEKRHHTNPVYQYHPLFREFLMSQTKDYFTQEDISKLQQKAALILEESGKIEDAVELYRKASDYDGVVRLILNQAHVMINHGRSQFPEEWIRSLPEEILNNSPWLLYWLGVCRMPFNPPDARGHFIKAFEMFEREKERSGDMGALLAWAGVVHTIVNQWDDYKQLDRWIDWLDERMRRNTSFPSPEIETQVASCMTGALLWRRPEHPEISAWVERTMSSSRKIQDASLLLQAYFSTSYYYVWMGDITNTALVINEMRRQAQSQSASPLMKITFQVIDVAVKTVYDRLEQAHSLHIIHEVQKQAGETGIYVLDHLIHSQGVYALLNSMDMPKVYEFLKKMETTLNSSSSISVSQLHYLTSWYNLHIGNISAAFIHAETAMKTASETGSPFIEIMINELMAFIYYKLGEYGKAEEYIAISNDRIREIRSKHCNYVHLLTKAQVEFGKAERILKNLPLPLFAKEGNQKSPPLKKGDAGGFFKQSENRALETLREAMELGRQQGYFTLFHNWDPEGLAKLCAKALEHGIEVDYARQLIQKLNLIPDVYIENWPWNLKIFTLGKFAILKQDKPLKSSRKAQEKPLDLLKAIIAFGGRGVTEELLSDALWPDSDADAAHKSFATTLCRLRQLLECEKAIQMHDGKLTLDTRYCCVDSWTFEKIINQAESLIKDTRHYPPLDKKRHKEINNLLSLSEKAMKIYEGDFLSGENDKPWAISMRERLKSRMLNHVSGIGAYFNTTGQFNEAVRYFHKGLEIDDLTEEFYQRLMSCYLKLGRRGEAVSVYQRCKNTFSAVIGITPSPETEAIYRSIN